MFNTLKGYDPHVTSNYMNPYAVDVIRTKRRDLVYGISHTKELLELLITEGVMTAAKRSIILTIRTRKDQNSRVLDVLEARGERACRKFFHPCLMLAEPELYQRIKTYVSSVSEHIQDTSRQLIGYLLERDQEGVNNMGTGFVTEKIHLSPAIKVPKKSSGKKRETRIVLHEKLLDKSAQSKSENLIHELAANGELLLLEELLEDININAMNPSNETLLHIAAEHGHLSIVERLIHRGARLDLQDNIGHTALHRAASRGHTEIVRVLATAGAPIHNVDLQGKTPIHLAAENEHLNSVKALVEVEAKQSESHTQDTFLHMAAIEDNWSLAELLLQSGAAVDAVNNHKNTALFYAVHGNNEKTVSVLLKAGAKVDYQVIHEATKLHQDTILQLLLGEIFFSNFFI